ncbi:MAG TPA: DUF6644 family protein [Usitatibacter sp.]|nr:DUF6644 family protein [Usitatibacter sp.]
MNEPHPGLVIAHTVGFVMLAGPAILFDLRVLGFSRRIPVRALARHLLPWSAAALLLVLPTGVLMFNANAVDLLGSPVFKVKMALLLTAATNAAIFHTGPFRSAAAWDVDATAPLGARACAAISIAAWLAIIACGQLLGQR